MVEITKARDAIQECQSNELPMLQLNYNSLPAEENFGDGSDRPDFDNPTILPSETPQFPKFFERWVKYWPANSKVGYHIKNGYRKGFFQQKFKNKKTGDKRTACLWGDRQIELANRHLDHGAWQDRLGHPPRWFEEYPIWLGLHIPRFTTVDAIDFDAKHLIVGHYEETKGWMRPVVHVTLDHIIRLKMIYDAFPDRIWCISSATLGIHAWQVHDRPRDSLKLHANNKKQLTELGLGSVESHPMPGRCLRRPFGLDYLTITPNGLIERWAEQVDYFEEDRRTPSFDHIVRSVLRTATEGWKGWKRTSPLNERVGKPKLGQFGKDVREIMDWLKSPSNSSSSRMLSCVSSLPSSPSVPKPQKKRLTDFDYSESRYGNWPLAIERWAANGPGENEKWDVVAVEIAKWLIWVELYGNADDVLPLLENWFAIRVGDKSSRWPQQKEEIFQQLARIVKSVRALAQSDRDQSLELFCRIRQKREQGRYCRLITVAGLLRGETIPIRDNNSSFLRMLSCVSSLPPGVYEQITKVAGRMKIFPFALAVINYLYQRKGSATISQNKFLEFLGYENKNQAAKYRDVLIRAGIINAGRTYSSGRNAKRYTLTKRVMAEINEQLARETKEEVG